MDDTMDDIDDDWEGDKVTGSSMQLFLDGSSSMKTAIESSVYSHPHEESHTGIKCNEGY